MYIKRVLPQIFASVHPANHELEILVACRSAIDPGRFESENSLAILQLHLEGVVEIDTIAENHLVLVVVQFEPLQRVVRSVEVQNRLSDLGSIELFQLQELSGLKLTLTLVAHRKLELAVVAFADLDTRQIHVVGIALGEDDVLVLADRAVGLTQSRKELIAVKRLLRLLDT